MKIKNMHGFTLLEVLVAVCILSIGIVSIIMLFSGSLRSLNTTKEHLDLAILATAEMRAILSLDNLENSKETIDRGDYIVDKTIEEVYIEKTQELPFRIFKIILKIKKGNKIFTLKTEKIIQKS